MYIVIKDNKVICMCNYEPCKEDLRTRGETFVFSVCQGINIGDDADGIADIQRP